MNDVRNIIRDIVYREFVGPDPIKDNPALIQENGEEIIQYDSPLQRYVAGILFPPGTTKISSESSSSQIQEKKDEENDDLYTSGDYIQDFSDDNTDDIQNLTNSFMQSAMGLTIAIKHDDSVFISISTGHYEKQVVEKTPRYYRKQISWSNNDQALKLPDKTNHSIRYSIINGSLLFRIDYRYTIKDTDIFTCSLINTNKKSAAVSRDSECYFQCGFTLASEKGFDKLPDSTRLTKDEDYLSNQMLYRHVRNYAIGHGCASDWIENDDGNVYQITTSIFPSYELKTIVPASIKGVSLSMETFADSSQLNYTITELKQLCDNYSDWINARETEKGSLDDIFREEAERHIQNCKNCLNRMRDGIKLLESNPIISEAFMLMNKAMLLQQLHYNLPLQQWKIINGFRKELINPIRMPEYEKPETWYGDKNRYGHWRPFQIAFILMNLKSINEPLCDERKIVDLIWFPTGGGKTEAYLGLSAFTIFLRRLHNPLDAGTSIIMRYTLRLLSAQQYARAASLICACEILRKEQSSKLGEIPISIGLYVGSASTPNTEKEAVKALDQLNNQTSEENPFIVLKCPWCGAEMGIIKDDTSSDVSGYHTEGSGKNARFFMRCDNPACDFSEPAKLPLYVIDETIYNTAPTLILGTVDKFAMLPYRPAAQNIFGLHNGKRYALAPDLIIQDELHLISGPLGSMVGMYETLISELSTTKIGDSEYMPKIIASTATISRAKEQCNALYACNTNNVMQFPPAGFDYSDSFFAKLDKSKTGRNYVGILASGGTSQIVMVARLFAILLYAGKILEKSNPEIADYYWTDIAYFNSIKELGHAETLTNAEVREQLSLIYQRHKIPGEPDYESRRDANGIISNELTSRISSDKVTQSLKNLEISLPHENHPIDICLATNMISVGLDIPRLGLMTVMGQPKTTSEYIQTTSRVGRNSSGPGLVFILYNGARPRDRSHYENFKNYHARVYCNVEPTSVTPFADPVIDRALHAIVVGLIRLKGNIIAATTPNPPTEDQKEYIRNIILTRIKKVSPKELSIAEERLKRIFEIWENNEPVIYEDLSGKGNKIPLMIPYGQLKNPEWGDSDEFPFKTLTSMRSVDASSEVYILGKY